MRARLDAALVWIALAAGAVMMAFPVYWMFATAVRPRTEIFDPHVGLLPGRVTWSNFPPLWRNYPLGTWIGNSVTIAVIAVALTVFVNLLCGYTFAKFRFFGRNVLFFAILG